MIWSKGRGVLGSVKPLLGEWITLHAEGTTGATEMRCRRSFEMLGKGWIELKAHWQTSPTSEYLERAMFGAGEDGQLSCFSFTSDGKKSVGRQSDGTDVDARAIAFEAQMPAGLARMIYWPRLSGEPGFLFAVESRTKKGWNRFLTQEFEPVSSSQSRTLMSASHPVSVV